ncbi:unnamed protein product [Ceratitis capitata]|uniref:(Mediterranean fruit fly) hypothetical protein n=1 Tax=Ceratitis capitata TaxID=7213 RepID=A0A811V9H8_CERCA|nr:unnamed protein product [Ceratitis capitata]
MEKNGKNGKTEKPPSPVSNEREAYVNAPPVATISISAQRSPTLCHTNCCTLFVACQQMAKTAKKCDYRFAKIDYTLQIPSGGIGGGADGVWTSLAAELEAAQVETAQVEDAQVEAAQVVTAAVSGATCIFARVDPLSLLCIDIGTRQMVK